MGWSVQFEGSATGGELPYTWLWDFGDGVGTSTEQNPEYTYAEAGEYIVTLTVTDDNSLFDSDSTEAYINEDTGELYPDAHGPYFAVISEEIQFTGSVAGGAPPHTWSWNFGDMFTSDEQNPVHSYSASGEYTVTLTVTDSDDRTGTNITIATTSLNDAPDIPSIDGESSGKAGEEYDYTFSTVDSDGDDVFYFIEWGDSSDTGWIGPYSSGEEVILSHIWIDRGAYSVRAKVKDEHGAESDWGSLEISMPKNKAINPFPLLLEKLMERFPILEQILQPICDKLTGF